MGWVKRSLVAVGVLSASVAALAMTPSADQSEKKEQEATSPRRERVIVRPQIEVFRSGGAQLGVTLRELDEAAVRDHKLASPDGALVYGVEPGSAAEKAGIKAGDVITSFDGERVRSVRHLQRLVGDTPPGRQVKVSVMRDGRKTEISVTPDKGTGPMALLRGDDPRFDALGKSFGELGRDLPRAFGFEVPDDRAYRMPRSPALPRAEPREWAFPDFPRFEWQAGSGRLGVTVQELTPQLGEYFGAKEGVLVASVAEDSPAKSAGLKAGDVITSVNGKAVTNGASLARMVREQGEGQDLSIGIMRDRKAQTLKAKLLSRGVRS